MLASAFFSSLPADSCTAHLCSCTPPDRTLCRPNPPARRPHTIPSEQAHFSRPSDRILYRYESGYAFSSPRSYNLKTACYRLLCRAVTTQMETIRAETTHAGATSPAHRQVAPEYFQSYHPDQPYSRALLLRNSLPH